MTRTACVPCSLLTKTHPARTERVRFCAHDLRPGHSFFASVACPSPQPARMEREVLRVQAAPYAQISRHPTNFARSYRTSGQPASAEARLDSPPNYAASLGRHQRLSHQKWEACWILFIYMCNTHTHTVVSGDDVFCITYDTPVL